MIKSLFIFFVVPFFLLLASCDYNVKTLNKLSLGQSTDTVINHLKESGIQSVIPVVSNSSRFKLNDITQLSSAEFDKNICLSDSKGLSVRIYFTDNQNLEKFYVSPKYSHLRNSIAVGESKQLVLNWIDQLLASKFDVFASACLADAEWIDLSEANSGDLEYLSKYNSWQYHESDSYSYVILEFSKNQLSGIKYHWRPFEG